MEFVSWDDEIPHIWKNNPNISKCSKPPPVLISFHEKIPFKPPFGAGISQPRGSNLACVPATRHLMPRHVSSEWQLPVAYQPFTSIFGQLAGRVGWFTMGLPCFTMGLPAKRSEISLASPNLKLFGARLVSSLWVRYCVGTRGQLSFIAFHHLRMAQKGAPTCMYKWDQMGNLILFRIMRHPKVVTLNHCEDFDAPSE